MDEHAITPDTSGKNQPDKYIRTFAGDMEIVQEGGVPDLAPLKQSGAAPAERLVEASPLVASPAPGLSQGSTPQVPTPIYRPPVPFETHIKTYAGDFSERMKETHASSATVLAAEQDSSSRVPQAVSEKSSRSSLLYVSAGVILLIAGIAGAYIVYTRYLTAPAPVVSIPSASAPIFVDEREEISGTGSTLLEAVVQSVASPLTPGTIRLLYVASTTKSVFSSLPLSVPDMILRNINANGSMVGVVDVGGNQSPFFILSVSSYSNTFAGMLSWEISMPRALGKLFGAYPLPTFPPTVSTTSNTSGQTSPPQAVTTTAPRVFSTKSSFRDETVGNYDVRVYRDEAGRSVMLYGYWNQTTLVIARDPSAFTEIVQRLATSRTQF